MDQKDIDIVEVKPSWPALSGIPEAVNAHNQNFLNCVLNLNKDAQQYLSFNELNEKQLSKLVVSFIQQVADTCNFLQHEIVDILTVNCRIGPELANIRQTLQNVQEQTYHTQSSIQKQNNQSWASVVRNAPPPAHTTSSHGSSSTAPATPSELSKDREVIIKLRDAGAVRTYRRLTASDIKQRAETAKQKTCGQTEALSLAKARFVAAR
ncbi:putative RNA-directed DNA polymerase from transposon X-element [Aspergillus affinis]|uniref:putative RNA-directed DNA polymerase from transposon X-element n=1 Tax=Aspergillus affinis TaxID=1070780 RepID=UPI0022FEC25F|nr:putative RNA-directed DNA polymerase from transposon X-element [Aspergillus affinis]KAI9035154.1 putative RNA-directed DNA polymerase from transposon X-element [Aspergillus affinis]